MADFLAVLSAEHRDNWQICAHLGLWGTSHGGVAASHVQQLGAGDRLCVWAAGPQGGLIASARITGAARPVRSTSEVPWPEPERYGFTFPIEVVSELQDPFGDDFDEGKGGNRTSKRLGLKGWQLQSGFAALDETQGHRCAEVFGEPADRPSEDHGLEPTRHRGRQPVSAVFLTSTSDVAVALLTLYRQRERCAEGELLVVGDEDQRATVVAELEREPFNAIRTCVRFATRAELAEELRSQLNR